MDCGNIFLLMFPQSYQKRIEMKKYICVYSLLFFFFSCQQNGTEKEVLESSLQHEVLMNDEYVIGKVRSMSLLVDSIPVLVNAQSDVLFQFMDYKDSILIEFGNRGQGPNDFLFPTSLYKKSDNELSFWDVNRKRYSSMSVSLKDSEADFKHHFNIRDSLFHYEIFPIVENQYVASGMYEDYRLVILNEQGHFKKGYGKCPSRDSREEKISGILRSEVYQGRMAVSSSGKRLVHALLRADIISFYEVKTEGDLSLITEYTNSYPEYSYDTGAMGFSAPIYNIDVSVTDQYVYILYSGRNFKESKDKAFLGNRIDVYDWEGRLVRKLHLDVDIKAMCITDDNKKIYAIAYLPDPVLVAFTLEFDNASEV